ncbi:MAG: fimbrillin family protein [Muribaculaceae bacterium]|nr:fimbrillin family protein [Muribaculaceae bacterium]
MRINSKYIYGLLGVSLALTGCSSEELTSPSGDANGETVLVTLTVDRSNAKTRTIISETETADGTGLSNVWEKGDQVTLVSKSGVVGTLTLEGDGGDSEGVFSGELTIANGEYSVWYLGADGAYASFAEGATEPSNALLNKDCSVSGDFVDLNKGDLMKSTVQIVVEDGKATVAANVSLEAQMAMAHFTLSGEGISSALQAEDATLTFAYGDNSYSITNKAEDVYVPMFPGGCKPSFTLVSGGKTYSYAFENETEVCAGVYYTKTQGDGNGISVTLVEKVIPEPPYNPATDEDLVGNMFEVNGKKFRFTRGNLKYDTETGAWSLMDNQYDFICKAGWTLSNGTWSRAKESVIDLFGYGATGLYDVESGQTANVPTFWKQTANQTYTDAAYYYPTQVTKWNEGYTGSYLERGIKFTNFDWGKAYYLYKNSEAYPTASTPYTSYDWEVNPSHEEGDSEALRYFTLSSDDWVKLQTKYFMCGVTITGIPNPANTSAKNNIYGCLIFPITGEGTNSAEINKDKLAKVKELLDGHYTYLSTKLTTNLNFTGSNYQYFDYSWLKITKEHFEALEKLGVVFLPEAGHRATDSLTKTDGYYWTSTNGQANTSTVFRFDGDSTPKVFKLDSQSSRTFGSAVRLVKEVPADYTDPVVVE